VRSRLERLAPGADLAALERDVRAELEAHLEHAVQARADAGADPATARAEAAVAFGDFERTVRACVRQKLGARLMLAKIHLAFTVLLGCALGFAIHHGLQLRGALAEQHHEARALAVALQARAEEPREIRLAIGDRLELLPTYFHSDLAGETYVEADGTALLPMLGHVQVFGLTRAELEARLSELYTPFYEDDPGMHVRVLPE